MLGRYGCSSSSPASAAALRVVKKTPYGVDFYERSFSGKRRHETFAA